MSLEVSSPSIWSAGVGVFTVNNTSLVALMMLVVFLSKRSRTSL